MTDQDRIADLERRMGEQEIRVAARIDAVIEAMTAAQAVTVDALALIALRDRGLVESLLRIRRLSHQAAGSSAITAELVKRYEMAIDLADQLASARPLGPK